MKGYTRAGTIFRGVRSCLSFRAPHESTVMKLKHFALGTLASGALLASCAASDAPEPVAKINLSPTAQTRTAPINSNLRLVAADAATPPARVKPAELSPAQFTDYQGAIAKTAAMTNDAKARQMAQKLGLDILNVTWEDTGRYKDSSVGPNISDMTIQVAARDPRTEKLDITAMPVIRQPNFSDVTADIDPREFTLLVGNQANRNLKRVSLSDFLNAPTAFMTRPWKWKGDKQTLSAPRDSKVLVSAQACFLPIPKKGEAVFNPVIFNYQSVKNDPAVLTILATREGTSMTIIDNTRDAFETHSIWGQRLFHNQNGERASLTGKRESDFVKANPGAGQTAPQAGKESGLNMVLLIQVPLKQKQQFLPSIVMDGAAMSALPAPMAKSAARSNVENAVIGHGALEGKFTETDDVAIERDPKFPVRVTVQFYKATDNGVVSEQDLKAIKTQINRVYSRSAYVGSLVTGGETGRITEYEGVKVQPTNWWGNFWARHEKNTGDSREVALEKLRKLLGDDYLNRPVSELYLNDLLRRKI